MYEAAAESLLMSVSKASKYIASVQPDNLINEAAWNAKLRWAAPDTLRAWANTFKIRLFFILSSNADEESIFIVNIFLDLHCGLAPSSPWS